MFTSFDVDSLFTNTNRALQRSMLLLDEHAPPSPADAIAGSSPSAARMPAFPVKAPSSLGQGHSPTTTTTTTAATASSHLSTSLRGGGDHHGSIATVQSLRGLGQLRAFVRAAADMSDRFLQEAVSASPAMARQRGKGVPYPVLARTVKGLRVQHLWGRSPDAERLWWHQCLGGGGGGGADHAPSASSEDEEGTGAFVAGRLLLAALCADLHHCQDTCLRLVRAWHCRPAAADTALLQLLDDAASPRGAALPADVLGGITELLSALLLRLCPPRILSAGMLLLPGWAAYVGTRAPPTLRARLLLRPLSALAEDLLPLYLRDEGHFALTCHQCLVYASTTVAQVLTSSPCTAPGDPRRTTALVQAVYNAVLLPLEERFTAGVARPGMARALHEELCVPFAQRHKPALVGMLERSDAAVAGMRNLLHTVHYRLLLLVETVGRSELVRESGGGAVHTAAQQKRYEGFLKQSHGRITIHLLSAVAEDKQLVLEASDSRAATGHVLHRLHDGSEDSASPVVHLYVDNGAVRYKVGRARSFTTAKTVEEIFKPFAM